MNLVEWIIIGTVVGGLGLTGLVSRYGYGTPSVAKKSTRQQSAHHGGRYYRGGKR
ncbi:MAG: hypothetical protein JXR95_08020 [Deltaproteobacteria bacterium]|nr:hypothetical protein [Deltaproteobacteria bacterium]